MQASCPDFLREEGCECCSSGDDCECDGHSACSHSHPPPTSVSAVRDDQQGDHDSEKKGVDSNDVGDDDGISNEDEEHELEPDEEEEEEGEEEEEAVDKRKQPNQQRAPIKSIS